jgi:hypothetical protein
MGAFRGRVAWVAWLGVLAAALALPSGVVMAAAPNQLSSPKVSPVSGDTTTTFSFSVHYVGDYPAVSVTAVVGSRTITLNLASGSKSDGIYAGSSRLPAGRWPVTFNAVATKANPPSTTGPTVTVARLASSPKPSAAPTQSSPSSPLPRSAAPSAVAVVSTSSGSTAKPKATSAAKPAAKAAPSHSRPPVAAAIGLPTDDRHADPPGSIDYVPGGFWEVMVGGLAVIGMVVAYYLFAMKRDRRRLSMAAEMAVATKPSLVAAPVTDEEERAPAVWEQDARLEDAPIGTVEYLPLENGGAIGSLPDNLSEPDRPARGNPRLARITDARRHRLGEDRRTLLRRG